jgi:hypothetical protein
VEHGAHFLILYNPKPSCFGIETGSGETRQRQNLTSLDQRGTGLSTPVTAAAVAARGGAEEQAAYLQHFRADSIVRDAVRVLPLPAQLPG